MKTKFYPNFSLKLSLVALCFLFGETMAQPTAPHPATASFPISIGAPCGHTSSLPINVNNHWSAKMFRYNGVSRALGEDLNCLLTARLQSPGFSIYSAGISYNPADHYLYYYRYANGNTYVWRYTPGGICPNSVPLFDTYVGMAIYSFAFDPDGLCYQLVYENSATRPGYDIAIRTVDFNTGSFGPVKTIQLASGVNIMSANGDLTLTPDGKMFMVWDNKFLTVNYHDYHTAAPLVGTLIRTYTGSSVVGLAFSEGKLVACDVANPANYYELDMLTGDRVSVTQTPCYTSHDLTEVISGVGAAKRLSSVIPTGVSNQYILSYDIYVQNYGGWNITDLQVEELLRGSAANGAPFTAANAVSNVSATLVSNPAGVTLNSAYNGISNRNLLAAGQVLPNYPSANNNFTVRVTFTVSNIVVGRVYNNNAIVKGRGFRQNDLSDVSTDGSNPDLNSNSKPDDPGEDRPTPFVILTTAEMPPCDYLNRVLYKQDFGDDGAGLRLSNIPAATGSIGTPTSDYVGSTADPVPIERFARVRNATHGNSNNWINLNDHTTGSGRFMVVNGDVRQNRVYSDIVAVPCGNLKYSLFAFVANIGNDNYSNYCNAFDGMVPPKLTFTVKNADNGYIITSLTTDDITNRDWQQYGMKFVMPAGITRAIIEITNGAAGGCGNDLAIDDIQFGLCDPMPEIEVNSTAGCTNGVTTFSAALSDSTIISGPLDYRWEVSNNGTSWNSITGANSVDYTISPLQASDIGRYYRVIVAAAGDINNANCRYTSSAFRLQAKLSSEAPTGIISDAPTTCPENPVTLTVEGGALGTNAVWRWYRNSCGDTLIGTGPSITVLPTQTTTYYVRAEGDCNTTECAQITVTTENCETLPVDFVQFSAIQRKEKVELTWKISTDERVGHFEVERSSEGKSFSTIATVKDAVPLNQVSSFKHMDNVNGSTQTFYYRIKVVNVDGKLTYSNTLTIKYNGPTSADKMKVTPNPASSFVNISLNADQRAKAEVQLLDMGGKIVLREIHEIQKGVNNIQIKQLNTLSDGVYTLIVKTDETLEMERLVIKR